MTSPALAKSTPSGNRMYVHPVTGESVPSVTTILNVLDKPALPRWAALEVATYAIENKTAWEGLPPRDALTLLKGAPWSKSKNAADAGTNAHAYCEAILRGEAPTEPVDAGDFAPLHGDALKNVRELLAHVKPTPIAIEATAWNSKFGYAGTFDGLHLIDGQITLVDLKTSKAVYPEMALQLAAYKYATHIVTPDGTEFPMPEIARCQIWHAPKEGTWSVVDMQVDIDEFATFTAALDVWRWKNTRADLVIPKKAKAKATK